MEAVQMMSASAKPAESSFDRSVTGRKQCSPRCRQRAYKKRNPIRTFHCSPSDLTATYCRWLSGILPNRKPTLPEKSESRKCRPGTGTTVDGCRSQLEVPSRGLDCRFQEQLPSGLPSVVSCLFAPNL